MKNFILFGVVSILILAVFIPSAYNFVTLQIEKHSIKRPPPFKTLAEVKGITKVEPATVSGKLKYPHDYTIVLLGDSTTEILGNSDELKGYLNEYYPDKTFEVLNYGFGSTNILSAMDRLTKGTYYHRDFRPILDIDFDLILIESFAHNPLSQFPLNEGLQKQTEALDQIVKTIHEQNPRAKIAFVATIAPNKDDYAKGSTYKQTAAARKKWVEERNAYFKNHIDYAISHNISLINVYQKSIDSNGSGKSIYINTTDHIHPSPTGVLFISREIADFIAKNELLRPD